MKIFQKRFFCLLLCITMLAGIANRLCIPVDAATTVTPTVSVGINFVLALNTSGEIYAWGNNDNGTLGNNSTVSASHPTKVSTPDGKVFTQISAGEKHALALTDDGSVYVWGANDFGQLGLETNETVTVPTALTALADQTIVDVAAGDQFSLALSNTGKIYAWGDNQYHQLGESTKTAGQMRNTPTVISALAQSFAISISAGAESAAAITSDGATYLWGRNDNFQLGTEQNPMLPFKPTSTKYTINAEAVVFGDSYTSILQQNGTMLSVGLNRYGQFANGVTTDSYSAVFKEATMSDGFVIVELQAASNHTVVRTQQGDVYTAGLRLQSEEASSSFTQLTVNGTAASVFAGYLNGAVLLSDGTLLMWGDNTSGQLGDGTTVSSSAPVAVKNADGSAFSLGKPASIHAMTFQLKASIPTPEFTITIPTNIDFGVLQQTEIEPIKNESFDVSASGVSNLFGEKEIVVTVTPENEKFVLTAAGGYEFPYEIHLTKTDDSALECGAEIATFTADATVTRYAIVDQSLIRNSGIYEGLLNFTIALRETEGTE
ncbi:MAG: hypothetical protein IJX80_07360 [Clostridia bacterium]|nr:hypothetical protein [Clostridia bacterium]